MESARNTKADVVRGLQPGQACLVLRDGGEADAAAVRSSFFESGVKVLEERRILQENGLITLVIVLPAMKLSDVMLALALKGVGGEIAGYESSGGP